MSRCSATASPCRPSWISSKGCCSWWNAGDTKALTDMPGAWSSVQEVVSRVVSASQVGKRMFSFAMVHIIASEVSHAADWDIDGFFKAADHTAVSTVSALKERLVKALLDKVGVELLPLNRMAALGWP